MFNRDGFTLVEVVISLVLFSMLLLGLLSLLTSSSLLNQRTEELFYAQKLAEEDIEALVDLQRGEATGSFEVLMNEIDYKSCSSNDVIVICIKENNGYKSSVQYNTNRNLVKISVSKNRVLLYETESYLAYE